MIEALKNTYVKFNNKIEKRLIIELYAMAGFKFDAFGVDEKDDAIIAVEVTQSWHCATYFSAVNKKNYKQLTISQLAFEYGLAPDWAGSVLVYLNDNGGFSWVGRSGFKTVGEDFIISHFGSNLVGTTSGYALSKYKLLLDRSDNHTGTDAQSFKVGDSCQFKIGGEDNFVSGFIKFKGEKYIVLESCTGKEYSRRISTVVLKPARTEKDVVVDLAVDHLVSATVSQSLTSDFYRAICESLYEAGILKKPD